ncbi:hydrophobin [Panaeolus papilionaceus]|nr:hydrophobin [Panaeolus papilionaceus]
MHCNIMQASFALTLALPAIAGVPSSCNTGPVQCCKQLYKANSADGQNLLGTIGVPVQGVTGLVGNQCSPVTAIGVGSGANCSNSPVCCTNNNFHGGVVSFGCSPVTINA